MVTNLLQPIIEKEWDAWVAARPDCVRVVAERFKPWLTYRLKTTGQLCGIYSFNENGTITIDCDPGRFDFGVGTRVFGINPDDLELIGDHDVEASRGDSRDAG